MNELFDIGDKIMHYDHANSEDDEINELLIILKIYYNE
jgi:hypothetical protein